MFYTVFRVAGMTHNVSKSTRYRLGDFSFEGGRSVPGHPPSLSIQTSKLVFPRFSLILSVVFAFFPHFWGYFLPVDSDLVWTGLLL